MKAILLAAGYGTRLRPLTDTMPKCLLPIADKPLLRLWLEKLQAAGVVEVIINTHYLHQAVEEFLKGMSLKLQVKTDFESALLGTAGTLRKHLPIAANEDLLLIHADNYLEEDLTRFIGLHKLRPPGTVMSMLTFETNEPSSCGIVKVDISNVVQEFYEKSATERGRKANGAIYLLAPEFLPKFNALKTATDFSKDVIPNLVGKIYAIDAEGPLVDIGTPARYYEACSLRSTLNARI